MAETVTALSEQLAILMGQHPLIPAEDFRAYMDREDADFFVASKTRSTAYPMVWTPEGFAVHQGEGCEGEQFSGPMGCWHSKEYTTMTQALVRAEAVLTPTPIDFNDDQMKVIKNTIAKGATDTELEMFVATCKRTGLDPFMRQIYAVKRYDSSVKGQVMAIQIGIDGQRLIAERTGKYDGQDPIEWLDEDGVWSQVWTGKGHFPVAARASVYRKDWTAGRKATAICRWDSYAQTYGQEKKLMPTWEAMPDVMLGKCAESLALRRAFPAEMSAIASIADNSYDPAADVAEMVDASPEAFEGSFTVVEPPAADPITKETEAEIVNLYHALRKAVGDEKFKVVRADLQKRWPHAFKFASNDLKALTQTEAVDVCEYLDQPVEAPSEACEHDPQYDETATVMKCLKCGAVLEGPDAEPVQAQMV